MKALAEPVAINVQQAATSTPARYQVPGSTDVQALSAFAHFDGTAAASSFRPALTFYSDAGLILARVFPGETVSAGDTADVTFAPFLDTASQATQIISALSLFDTTLAAPAASVDTSGFDLSGGHVLEVWSITRTDEAVGGPNMRIRFNGDSGNNYDYDWVRNVAGAVGAVDVHPDSSASAAETSANYTAKYFAINRVTVPGYDQSVSGVFKVGEFTGYVGDSATAAAGAGIRVYTGGLVWRNEARITQITWTPNAGFNFLAGSRFLVLRR